MEILGNVSELTALSFRHSVSPNKQVTVIPHESFGPTLDITFKLPPIGLSDVLVSETATQTLTGKTLTSPTISGGSFSGASWSGGTISNTTITGSSISGGTLVGLSLSSLNNVSGLYVGTDGQFKNTPSGTAYSILRVNSTATDISLGAIDISQTGAVGSSILKLSNGGTGTGAGFTTNGVILGSSVALFSTAAGSAYESFVVPAGGGTPGFGAVELAQPAAVTGNLPVTNGGTGANNATTARANLSAAQSGANTDITSLDATGDVKGGSLFTTSATGTGLQLATLTAAPATPTAGNYTIYADSTTRRLYAKDQLGGTYRLDQEWAADPSAILNPTDAYSNWINGTGGTYTVTTAAGATSPLFPAIQRYISIAATANIASPTAANTTAYQGTLPPALGQQKLRAEFAITTPAADSWRFDVFIDGTRVSLSTDDPTTGYTLLPSNFTGTFTSFFDSAAPGSSYTYSFSRTSGTGTTTLYLTDFSVTKGRIPQGPALGSWISAGIPTLSWVVGVNTAASSVRYRRIGDSAEIYYYIVLNGAPTATSLVLTLPAGLTLDTTKIVNGQYVSQVGALEIATAAGGSGYNAQILTNGTTNTLIAVYQNALTGAQTLVTQAAPITFASGNLLTARVLVPISTWSSTVQLGQNDEDYLSHDGTQVVYGSQGSLVPNIAAGGAPATYTIPFPTPSLSDTKFHLEFQFLGAGPWVPAEDAFPAGWQGSYAFGAQIIAATSTSVNVYFGGGGARATNGTYGDPSTGATGWNSVSTARWRIRRANGGAAAGFGLVRPGFSSGLVPSQGLPANATGALTTTGYVGEVAEATVAGTTSVGATNTYWDVANIAFAARPAGVYHVSALLTWVRNGATIANTDLELALLTTAGAVAPAAAQLGQSWIAQNAVGTSATFTRRSISIPSVIVRWTGTQLIYAGVTATATTLYLKAFTGNWSVATPQHGARLTAVRIA